MTIAAALRKLLTSQPLSDLVSRGFRHDIPSRGARFRTNNTAIGSKTPAELFFRLYERHEIALIRTHMLTGLDVLELGAGIGVTGSHVLRRLDRGRRLVSVEANDALLPTLRSNLARHQGNHDVTVLHAAVSYSGSASVTLNHSPEHMTSRLGSPSAAEVAVPATTLGALVERFGLDNYVLISDIEGAESDVIIRDGRALESCQQIIVELHGSASDITRMLTSLAGLGFVVSAHRKTIYAFERPVTRNVDRRNGAASRG